MDEQPLTPPRIYLIRMAVFLILAGFVAFILYRQIIDAFMANPGLNGLIIGVTLIGIVLAIRQVVRLFPRDPLGQHFPASRRRRAAAQSADPAGAHVVLHQRPHAAIDPVGGGNPLAARFHRRAPGREPGDRSLPRRIAGLPRFARHLLGPDRYCRIGRAHHLFAADGAGFGGPFRRAQELAGSARSRAWACPSRPRCSALPVRSC